MAQPHLALRTTGNGLFSYYIIVGSKNPLPLGMGSVKNTTIIVQQEEQTDID